MKFIKQEIINFLIDYLLNELLKHLKYFVIFKILIVLKKENCQKFYFGL